MRDYRFGQSNWFIKNALYDFIIKNADRWGMSNIEFGECKLDQDVLYDLAYCIRFDTDAYNIVSNREVLAVLYKLSFDFNPPTRVQAQYNRKYKPGEYMDSRVEALLEEQMQDNIW